MFRIHALLDKSISIGMHITKKHIFIQKLGISRITEATIFREAETMFNSEMGQALGCSASDVPGIIHEMVTTAERQK